MYIYSYVSIIELDVTYFYLILFGNFFYRFYIEK